MNVSRRVWGLSIAAVPERLECGVEPVATVTVREEKVA